MNSAQLKADFLQTQKRLPPLLASSSSEILNSWKEIAAYLNRGVRTVQRWEAELGLPVRRPRGKSRSAVIATRSELEKWIMSCPKEARRAGAPRSPEVALRDSVLKLQRLRKAVGVSRNEMAAAVHRYLSTVENIARSWFPPLYP